MRLQLASTIGSRLLGLRRKEGFEGELLLVPCKDVHTFGMRRAIDVAFVAPDGTVLESHRGVAPNRRLRNRRAAATVERFSCGKGWYSPGDPVGLVPLSEGRVGEEAKEGGL